MNSAQAAPRLSSRLARLAPEAGFTMIELITTIVLLGIVSALFATRFFERESFDARAYSDQVATMLHYGQKLAIAQNRPVYVRFNSNSVALCFSSANCLVSNDQVLHPSGANSGTSATLSACANNSRWYCEALPTGLTQSFAPNAALTGFYFDALGKPFALTDAYPSVNSNFVTTTLTITSSKPGSSSALVIEQETGYVHQ
ncbi:MAG: prepilin-type N-terminal cleavage/methylation domain-containing protein [Burkholderiales bacterium]|nr:prepilin-type N-terminal cleavage/methylation domain-containing protein [Burkholderiales bacterium]